MVFMLNTEEIRELVIACGGAGKVARKLGVREQTVYRLVNGLNKPSFDTALKLEGLRDDLINS